MGVSSFLLLEKARRERTKELGMSTGGLYDFDRMSVVEFSQLIAQHLEDKPPSDIDSHRIYNYVEYCYRDLERGWSDNPAYYHLDVHMLLATCAASTWFTDNQRSRINEWMTEQGWLK